MLAEGQREPVIRSRMIVGLAGAKGSESSIRSTRHANGVIAAQFGRYA